MVSSRKGAWLMSESSKKLSDVRCTLMTHMWGI